MELEVAGLHDKSLKARSQAKIRGYKSQLSSKRDQMVCRRGLRGFQSGAVSSFTRLAEAALILAQKSVQSTLDRSDLLGFASDPSSAEAGGGGHNNQQAQRTRMLSATDKLNDSSRRLEDSHRIALETEDLGQGILGNLRVQRDQITGTRDRLQQADQSIDKASGTLGKMIRKCVPVYFYVSAWLVLQLRPLMLNEDGLSTCGDPVLQDVPTARGHLSDHCCSDLPHVRSSSRPSYVQQGFELI